MKRLCCACIFLFAFSLAGCSAHSPFIGKDTEEVHHSGTSQKYDAHTKQVYVTIANLPPGIQYETLATLEIGKVWYGSDDKVRESMAEEARKIGADAVVEIKTWHQPSGWSWSAPHGSGKAIKLVDTAKMDWSDLGGEWR